MGGPGAVTLVVISPHLDDAVLCVGGRLAAASAPVVATIYTDAPPLERIPPALHPFGDYATRRPEDAAACAVVGATARWLGHVERVFRPPPLPRLGYFTTPPDRDGFADLPALVGSLEGLGEPACVLAPLGVGNHVDHVATLLATVEWCTRHGWLDRLAFYEDFYALSGALRAAHPVARAHRYAGDPLRGAPRLAEILEAIDRARGGPPIEALWPALAEARWTVEVEPVDVERKLAAIACYGSQVTAFGGMAGLEAAVRAYDASWGGEPVWRLAS